MDPLEKNWHLYKGPFYVHGCGLVGHWLISLQLVDIRWTLSIKYNNKGPSYVRGCGLVSPWLIGLQRVDIRWTLSIYKVCSS